MRKKLIELAEAGYTMPIQAKNIKVQGRAGHGIVHGGSKWNADG
jgi:hypothetical protein